MMIVRHVLFLLLAACTLRTSAMEFSQEKMRRYREKVKNMFYHAYDSYLTHAYPLDELKPISCSGMDTWGSFSLTLVDALDTLVIMGNDTEFRRAAELVLSSIDVDANVNVSVFETNIRVVGGLLTAHMLSGRVKRMALEPGWPCSGPLLRLAERVAQKLLPAFNTDTGMPYGTVNLKYGVHRFETPITCTAGVGTFLLEFGTLSRLTGNPHFERIALRALNALWKARSSLGLVGNHINIQSGAWTATDAGIGAGVDSYFEYLAKSAILFQKPELMRQFNEFVSAIDQWVRKEDWFMWVTMTKGQVSLPIFQSLEAFWPGVLALVGDVDSATRILLSYQQILKQYGFLPEFYNIPNQEAVHKRSGYPLRPEFAESLMYLYRSTEDPQFLQLAAEMVEAIEHSSRTECGYATIVNVKDHTIEDRMESFFLAETTKYLYLIFDPENFIHNDGETAREVETPNGKCIVEAGGYIFNTEAHPLDPGMIYCCSAKKHKDAAMIQQFEDNIDLVQMLGLGEDADLLRGDLLNDLTDLPSETLELLSGQNHNGGAYSSRHSFEDDDIGFEIDEGSGHGAPAGRSSSADETSREDDDYGEGDGQRKGTNGIGVDAAKQLIPPPVQPSVGPTKRNNAELDQQVKAILAEAILRAGDKKKPNPGGSGSDKKPTEKLAKTLVQALNSMMDEWNGLVGATKQLDRLSLGTVWSSDADESYGADLVAPCNGCCRRLDAVTQSTSLRRMLSAMYGKHIYPKLGIRFYLGPICMERDKPPVRAANDEYMNEHPNITALEDDDDNQTDGVDRLQIGSFRYRDLARRQYELLTCPASSFHTRFTGLGQVALPVTKVG